MPNLQLVKNALGFSLGIICFLAGGCASVTQSFNPQILPVPQGDYFQRDSRSDLSSGLPLSWKSLNDGVLPGLIHQALAENPSIDELSWRVREAKQVVRIVSGQTDPFADFVAGYERRKQSSSSEPFVQSNGQPFNFFSVGLNSRWEIDLVGRIEQETKASVADYRATAEDLADLRRLLAGDVARSYVQLRLGQELKYENEKNAKLQKSSIPLVKDRITAGKVSKLDLVQLESRVSLTESDTPLFDQGVQLSLHQVALLSGRTPGNDNANLLHPMPQLSVPSFEPEVPANLVRRRPDIRRAEREVEAAFTRIGVAKAEYYPRLNILGTISFDTRSISDLLDFDSLAFSIGPGITWNILSLGRIEAQVEIQRTQLKQAIARYRQTVLTAVSEVENALAAQRLQHERIQVLERSLREANESVELAVEQYKADQVSLERVVSNQRRLLQSSILLAEAKAARATAAIDLIQALGGSEIESCSQCQPVVFHSASVSPPQMKQSRSNNHVDRLPMVPPEIPSRRNNRANPKASRLPLVQGQARPRSWTSVRFLRDDVSENQTKPVAASVDLQSDLPLQWASMTQPTDRPVKASQRNARIAEDTRQ